ILYFRGLLLRNTKIHVNGIERLQGNDRCTGSQVLSQIHLADAEQSGEGRANGLAFDRRTKLSDVGLGLTLVRTGFVVIRAGDDTLTSELLGTVEVDTSKIPLSFQSSQLG